MGHAKIEDYNKVPVYQIDPLTDPRWQEFTARHPRASVFHSSGWLRALQLAYGYEPIAYTLSPPQSEVANAVVFSRIRSWATGRRLVSLPFSDHCEPLVDGDVDAAERCDVHRRATGGEPHADPTAEVVAGAGH